uniref:Uncharacterized protein n=1 Tax=Caenorhabditis japonica TaxID=281687 RepID=A0A8R1I5A6_CAEJA
MSSFHDSATSSSALPSCSPIEEEHCAVCGDRVNSNRYGVPACLGCIVFFRRAIVNNSKYKCVKHQRCVITNEFRCSCRYCRLQKCLMVGMRPDAIQRRDVVGPRKPINLKEHRQSSTDYDRQSPSSPEIIGLEEPELLKTLASFQKHQTAQHLPYFAEHDLASGSTSESMIKTHRRRARVPDVNIMLKLSLNQATDWGKQFQPFCRLAAEFQQNILAEYAFGFLLVDQGFKTAYEAEEGLWLLQNGSFMHSDYYYGLPEKDGKKENSRVKAHFHFKFVTELLNCVSTPFRDLQIDDIECVALKTVLLLTPSFPKRAVYAGQEHAVAALHTKCMRELMEHAERRFPGRGEERFGEILLLVSSIRCAIKAMYNQTRVSDVFNFMEFDPFVRDMLLN